MPPVLTTASTLTCGAAAPHAGTVSIEGAQTLQVGGAPVLTRATVKEGSIAGCTNQSSSTTKCSGIAPAEPTGIATRLKVDGEFVALSTLKAKTNGVPPSTVVVVNAANDLLTAV
jgi:hypothetical protein